MAAFLKPRSTTPTLAPGIRVLKAEEYSEFVQARTLLEQARHEAKQLRAQAESAYSEAQQQGYQAGLAQGQAQATTQILQTVAGSIDYLGGIERQLAGIVMTAIRRILGEFDDETRALAAVRNALTLLRQNQRVTVRVAPQTAALLSPRLDDLTADLRFLEIVVDNRLSAKDCVLESEIGIVNAGIDEQITALQSFLEHRLGRALPASVANNECHRSQDCEI